MYRRKTHDVYDVEGDYGQGWEVVTAGNIIEARANLREHRANEPGTAFRLHRTREACEGESCEYCADAKAARRTDLYRRMHARREALSHG